MKIGFVNIYSFRPHVEHLYFLSKILKDAGHEVFFLTCDSSVSDCYVRELKQTSRIKECSKCILGGVRSFSVSNITSISSKAEHCNLSEEGVYEVALSSSCTLNRTESENEWNDPEIEATRENLYPAVQKTYSSTINWIQKNGLEAVVCFNGRMDLTRAITYACEALNVPYVTHERTWFGDGLQLVPNANCLSISALGKMVRDFDDKYLTKDQAALAGRLIAERFLQQNTLEWRVYNQNPESVSWPIEVVGKKVLVLPSSKNEFAGHKEWLTEWKENTQALSDLFEAFSIQPQQVVVRFHPNWAENIGKVPGDRSRNHYKKWAQANNIFFFDSDEKANTYDLIQQADIVVLNGGSSSVEAGACGKQVICLGPSTYDQAGFVRVFKSKADLYSEQAQVDLPVETVIRKTLRFVYLRAKRFPQFVDYVKAIATTEYQYYQGADANRLIKMFETGELDPDDCNYSDTDEEGIIVSKVMERDWVSLKNWQQNIEEKTPVEISRRFGLRWIDGLRSKMPRGDR